MIVDEVDANNFFLHVIYDGNFFGWGLVFSPQGKFIYALSRKSVEEIKSYSKNGISKVMDYCYHIVDPADQASLINSSSKVSIDNFNIYFRKTFLDSSPWIDSATFFQSNILKYIDPNIFNGSVLDLGAGGCQYLKESRLSITRLDLYHTTTRLDYFSKNTTENRVVGNVRAIPFDANSFDLILCNFLLEHVPDIREVAKEIDRVLKCGGKAIISFPSLNAFETLKIYLLGKRISLPLNHLRAFGIVGKTLCESTPRFLGYFKSLGLSISVIEGIECIPSKGKIVQRINNILGNIFPFKYLGAQTIVVIRKNKNNSTN